MTLQALADHCSVPLHFIQQHLPVSSKVPGVVAFHYKTGDIHKRKVANLTFQNRQYSGDGLGAWIGWNKGAAGQQLWGLPPEDQIEGCLIVEGETAAVCASYALRSKGWMIIATSGSRFPAEDDRNQVIQQWNVPVVLWPDPDPPGQKWCQQALQWLAKVYPAVADWPGDVRDWWKEQEDRYGLEGTEHFSPAPDVLHELLLAFYEADQKDYSEYDPVKMVPVRHNLGSAQNKAPSLTILLASTGATPSTRRDMWHCGNTANHSHGDRNPSLKVDLEQNVYYCHTCQEGGDNVSLAAQQKGQSVKEYLRSASDWGPMPVINLNLKDVPDEIIDGLAV